MTPFSGILNEGCRSEESLTITATSVMQGPPVSAEGIERADPERPEIKRKEGLQAQFRECAQRLGLTRADKHRRDRRRLPLLELILDSLACPHQ